MGVLATIIDKDRDTIAEQFDSANSFASLVPAGLTTEEVFERPFNEIAQIYPLRYQAYVAYLRAIRSDDENSILELKNNPLIQRLIALNNINQAEELDSFLRNHQQQTFLDFADYLETGKSIGWMKLPTGYGKTVLAAKITQETGLRTVMLVPRTKLIHQTEEKFNQFVPNIKVTQFYGDKKDITGDCVVVTYQSLEKFVDEALKTGANFAIQICDEAHRSLTPRIQALLDKLPKPAFRLGITATTDFSEDKSVRTTYGDKIAEMSLNEAIEANMCSPVIIVPATSPVNLSDVKTNSKGEFLASELAKKVDTVSRNKLAIEFFQHPEIAGKSGIVNCVTIEHAENFAEQAREAGLNVVAIHSKSKDRDKILQDYEDGKITILAQVDTLTEGWDSPRTTVMANLRPTSSWIVAEQRLGRVVRLLPDKIAYVLDIVDNGGTSSNILASDILDGLFIKSCDDKAQKEKIEQAIKSLKAGAQPLDIEDLSSSSNQLIFDIEGAIKYFKDKDRGQEDLSKERALEILRTHELDNPNKLLTYKLDRFYVKDLSCPIFRGRGSHLIKKYLKDVLKEEVQTISRVHYMHMMADLFPEDQSLVYSYNYLLRGRKTRQALANAEISLDTLREQFATLNITNPLDALNTGARRFYRSSYIIDNIRFDGEHLARAYYKKLGISFGLANLVRYEHILSLVFGEDAVALAKEERSKLKIEITPEIAYEAMASAGFTTPERAVRWGKSNLLSTKLDSRLFKGSVPTLGLRLLEQDGETVDTWSHVALIKFLKIVYKDLPEDFLQATKKPQDFSFEQLKSIITQDLEITEPSRFSGFKGAGLLRKHCYVQGYHGPLGNLVQELIRQSGLCDEFPLSSAQTLSFANKILFNYTESISEPILTNRIKPAKRERIVHPNYLPEDEVSGWPTHKPTQGGQKKPKVVPPKTALGENSTFEKEKNVSQPATRTSDIPTMPPKILSAEIGSPGLFADIFDEFDKPISARSLTISQRPLRSYDLTDSYIARFLEETVFNDSEQIFEETYDVKSTYVRRGISGSTIVGLILENQGLPDNTIFNHEVRHLIAQEISKNRRFESLPDLIKDAQTLMLLGSSSELDEVTQAIFTTKLYTLEDFRNTKFSINNQFSLNGNSILRYLNITDESTLLTWYYKYIGQSPCIDISMIEIRPSWINPELALYLLEQSKYMVDDDFKNAKFEHGEISTFGKEIIEELVLTGKIDSNFNFEKILHVLCDLALVRESQRATLVAELLFTKAFRELELSNQLWDFLSPMVKDKVIGGGPVKLPVLFRTSLRTQTGVSIPGAKLRSIFLERYGIDLVNIPDQSLKEILEKGDSPNLSIGNN